MTKKRKPRAWKMWVVVEREYPFILMDVIFHSDIWAREYANANWGKAIPVKVREIVRKRKSMIKVGE